MSKWTSAKDLYYEAQATPDSCFVHATNAFFQRPDKATPQTLEELRRLFATPGAADAISACKRAGVQRAFWPEGTSAADVACLRDDTSDPSLDEDLAGYSEIYSAMSPADFLDSCGAGDFRELSPPQALFLLEFRAENGGTSLVHVPHRFLHRYARAAAAAKDDDGARAEARFAAALDAAAAFSPGSASAFLCRIQRGRSHALAACHSVLDGWVVLDSLEGRPVPVGSALNAVRHCAQASVLIVRDPTRPCVRLV